MKVENYNGLQRQCKGLFHGQQHQMGSKDSRRKDKARPKNVFKTNTVYEFRITMLAHSLYTINYNTVQQLCDHESAPPRCAHSKPIPHTCTQVCALQLHRESITISEGLTNGERTPNECNACFLEGTPVK